MELHDRGWEQAYSEHNGPALWSENPIPCLEEVADELTDRACWTVLDVGCGDGRNLHRLVERGLIGAGVDMSETALRRAATRLEGRAFLMQGNAIDLSMLADSSLDAITCLDMFGQVNEVERMLSGFQRVLRPGGTLAFNAFTLSDSEYGRGVEIGQHKFSYQDTLFRFYEEHEIRGLLNDWRLDSLDRKSWLDPPHGEFRPYSHTHDNWIVIASNNSGN